MDRILKSDIQTINHINNFYQINEKNRTPTQHQSSRVQYQ
jgi:hypothetical protein